MLKKTKFLLAAAFIASVFLSASLLLMNAKSAVNDSSFYASEFRKYGVYDELKGYNVDEINNGVIEFINSRTGSLPEGFFTEREISHLKDVKNTVRNGYLILLISIQLFAGFVVLSLFMLKDIKKILFYVSLCIALSSMLTLIIGAVFLISVKTGFSASFEIFHKSFFDSGSYTFNPAVEKIVVLYPENLFYDAGIKILINSLIWSVLLLFVSFLVMWFTRKKKSNISDEDGILKN